MYFKVKHAMTNLTEIVPPHLHTATYKYALNMPGAKKGRQKLLILKKDDRALPLYVEKEPA